MPEAQSDFLSIGEVLGLLAAEFPEVTISKIRFLESQGLISPERTPSGYRRFHEADVDLLRVILTEQRENYLPLRVIKDRIESGEIDPSGEMSRPNGIPRPVTDASGAIGRPDPAAHPAAGPAASRERRDDQVRAVSTRPEAAVTHLLPGVVLSRDEFRAMTGLDESELADLESYGLVQPRPGSSAYGEEAVEIALAARALLRAGVDARHLRGWRTAADREVSLIEQLLMPQMRAKGAGGETAARARDLADQGSRLRAALVRAGLRRFLER
jgi:DNA-binding transcriptional MerR regulator